jgi:hypothetical protein
MMAGDGRETNSTEEDTMGNFGKWEELPLAENWGNPPSVIPNTPLSQSLSLPFFFQLSFPRSIPTLPRKAVFILLPTKDKKSYPTKKILDPEQFFLKEGISASSPSS